MLMLWIWLMLCVNRRRQWHSTPVRLPGEAHGRKSLVGCSPWGWEELDTTEQFSFHFSPSCIGEGNGNLLQCSCLESPRDGGAWWAAIYGVTQSQTRLKWLSSSSSIYYKLGFNSMWTVNFQMFKLDLEKAEIKLPTSAGSLKKEENSRETSKSSLLTMTKHLSVWITTNSRKLFKR